MVLLALAGVIALPSLASSIYPPLQFPRVVVVAHSGILPARAMMLNVTRPLEQALREVPGIRRVRSKTFRGSAELSALFEPATNMDLALQQVQARIAEGRSGMPAELDLQVERLSPSTFPMYSLILTGGLPIADLRDYAFYVMRPAFSRIPGVGRVEVQASDSREIEVVADPVRLAAAGLTLKDVGAALAAANQLAPIGRYTAGGLQYLVLASGAWRSAADVAATPVAVRKGATLRVGDLARVFPGSPDRTLLASGNGRDAALVTLSQQIGTDVLAVKAGIEQALAGSIAPALPSGLRISKVYDLAEFVSTAIANVRDAILLGGVLAIVVLIVFLGDWRMTAIAALTLPLTVVATFSFMRLFGESINLMSMGGLAVAIGLVIDDAVVVIENVHRRLGSGGDAAQEVDAATQELVAPVVGSTLTTVVVLAPLGLLSGVSGQFFRALSLTLSVAVLISLFLSLTLIPLLSRRVFGGGNARERARRVRQGRACGGRRHRSWGGRDRRASLGAMARSALRRSAGGCVEPAALGGDRGPAARRLRRPAGLEDPQRLPATDGRGRLRPRLPHPGGHGARGDRSHGPRHGAPGRGDAGGGGLLATHRRRAGPLRHRAEQGRRAGAAQAAVAALAVCGGDHRPTAQADP